MPNFIKNYRPATIDKMKQEDTMRATITRKGIHFQKNTLAEMMRKFDCAELMQHGMKVDFDVVGELCSVRMNYCADGFTVNKYGYVYCAILAKRLKKDLRVTSLPVVIELVTRHLTAGGVNFELLPKIYE